MEQKKSAFNAASKFAIIISLVLIIFSVAIYITNVWRISGLQWVGYFILLIGVIWAIRDHREKDLGGFISYGEGFKTGLYFSLLVAVISAIFGYIMMTLIAPDMIQEILKLQESKFIEKGLSDEQIETAQKMSAPFMTPPILSLFTVIFYSLFGIVASLIVAAILKKENPTLEQPQ